MAEELSELYEPFSFAHTLLQGMTHTLNKAFGNSVTTEEQVKRLLNEGERVEIYQGHQAIRFAHWDAAPRPLWLR
jgi:hypothetical protein